MGTVFNIQKYCIHDGDGIRTTVFLKGCPLKCIWCHNPESLDRHPIMAFSEWKCTGCGRCLAVCERSGSCRSIVDGQLIIEREKCTLCGSCVPVCLNDANDIIGYEITPEDAFKEVLADKMFYGGGGGMTVSGGEPSYQPEFTLQLLRMAKDEDIGRAIETCGAGKREFYEEAAALGTTFLFDLKCIDPEKHRELTGVDNKHILDNLRYLMDCGADVIIRMPMVPGCNDTEKDIADRCEFLKEHEGKYRYAEIMPYHTLGVGKAGRIGETPMFEHENASTEDKARWKQLFADGGIEVKISE